MQPVTEPSTVGTYASISNAGHTAIVLAAAAAAMVALAACDLPFALGQPATRALEDGAVASLDAARSFRITGWYTDPSPALNATASSARISPGGVRVSVDLQLVKPSQEHVVISAPDVKLEAIVVANAAYFRGQQFLSQHMGGDQLSRNLVRAAGSGWWKGAAGNAPRLPDFTDGKNFRSTFLGTAVTQRSDHESVDGFEAVRLSGPRAVVYIAASPPYQVLRVQLKNGVVVDGITDGVLRFDSFDRDFQIAAPTDVIDFSNLSTLPPIYTVVSVDTSRCLSPCTVSALLRNLGGLTGARAQSTITFVMTDSASGLPVGSCTARVETDVGYNSTTTAGCTMSGVGGQPVDAASVTATADNPGRA